MKEIKEIIAEVLEEIFQSDIYMYHAGQQFPYEVDDYAKLPYEVSPNAEYFMAFQKASNNNDVYEFPYEEFKKGIDLEAPARDKFPLFDIADIVLKNLRKDPKYYTNALGQYDGKEEERAQEQARQINQGPKQ